MPLAASPLQDHGRKNTDGYQHCNSYSSTRGPTGFFKKLWKPESSVVGPKNGEKYTRMAQQSRISDGMP